MNTSFQKSLLAVAETQSPFKQHPLRFALVAGHAF